MYEELEDISNLGDKSKKFLKTKMLNCPVRVINFEKDDFYNNFNSYDIIMKSLAFVNIEAQENKCIEARNNNNYLRIVEKIINADIIINLKKELKQFFDINYEIVSINTENKFIIYEKDQREVKFEGTGIDKIVNLLLYIGIIEFFNKKPYQYYHAIQNILEIQTNLNNTQYAIIFDEIERDLHPSLQIKLMNYIKEKSKDFQFILSTHSPYIFKENIKDNNIQLITRGEKNKNIELKLFPWSPSYGEINYFSYGLETVEFFNELYGYLQSKNEKYSISAMDNYLVKNGIEKDKKWIREPEEKVCDITYISYIRNSIHHPENNSNDDYTQEGLKNSIEKMIELINKAKN